MFIQIVPVHMSENAGLQRRGYMPRKPGCQHGMGKHSSFQEMLDPSIQSPWEPRTRGGKIRLHYRPFGSHTDSSTQISCLKKRRERSEECPIMRKQPKVTKSETLAILDFRGFNPDEIKVKVTEETVTVCGQRNHPNASFRVKRSLPLPPDADNTGIVCRFVNGEVIVEKHLAFEGTRNTRDESTEEKTSDKQVVDTENTAECDGERPTGTEESRVCAADRPHKKVAEDSGERLLPVEKPGSADTAQETSVCEKPGSADTAQETSVCEKPGSADTAQETSVCEKPGSADTAQETSVCEKPGSADTAQETSVCEREGTKREGDTLADDTGSVSIKPDVVITETTGVNPEFKVQIDLSDYQPNNIRVRFKEGELIVEAEREVEGDDFFEVEKLTRRIHVPENVAESELKSVLNGGMMTIKAPLVSDEHEDDEHFRVVHIQ